MLILCNAFSLNMLAEESQTLKMERVLHPTATRLWLSLRRRGLAVVALGHEDLARVVATELQDSSIVACRATVTLGPDDTLLVAQYRGPRLPEGATSLPEGSVIEGWTVEAVEE